MTPCRKCGQDLAIVGSYKGLVCKGCRKRGSVARRKGYRVQGLCGCGHSITKGKMCDGCKRTGRAKYAEDNVRSEVFEAYGGACTCCGERRIELLTVDHAPPLGAPLAMRHALQSFGVTIREGSRPKYTSGRALYFKLRARGFPKDGYRILCMNCNSSRGFWGYCPHERELGFCELFYGGKKHLAVFVVEGAKSTAQQLARLSHTNPTGVSELLAQVIEDRLVALSK